MSEKNNEAQNTKEITAIEDLELAQTSGGGIYHEILENKESSDPDMDNGYNKWKIVNEKGETIANFSSLKEANYYCDKKGITKNRIWFKSTINKMKNAYASKEKYLPEIKLEDWENPYGHNWYS